MKRLLSLLACAMLLAASTGCLHHNVRGGADCGCAANSCASGACGGHAGCQSGACGGAHGAAGLAGGHYGYAGGRLGGGRMGNGALGCRQCGQSGCRGACGGALGAMLNGQLRGALWPAHGWRHQQEQMGPAGPPTGQVAYPYYTIRGPRDFLLDNPPSIGL